MCRTSDVSYESYEFIASVANENVARTELGPHDVSGFLKDGITEIMAERIVDMLKIVDVHYEHDMIPVGIEFCDIRNVFKSGSLIEKSGKAVML